MKNLLSYLIGFLASLPLLGQDPDFSKIKGDQQLDSIIIFGTTGQPVIKKGYTYNEGESGRLQHTFWSFWEGEGEWLVQTRTDHYYNDQGKPVRDIDLAFKQQTNQYDTLSVTFFIYDENGNKIKELQRAWDNFLHMYKNNMEFDYTYDEYDRMTERINLNWDDATSTWINYEKIIFNYTGTGRDSTRITCYYSYQIEDWSASKKVVYYYDKDGNDTLLYEYNVYSIPPELSNKTVQEFDENGFITSSEVYQYQDSNWLPYYKHDYVPDPFGNILTDIHFRIWSEVEEKWFESSQTQYYYSGPAVSASNGLEAVFTVFPSPAGSYISFNLPYDSQTYRVQLYNLQGLKVIDQVLNNNILLVYYLPRGVYVYKLLYGRKVCSGKIILQ